MTDIVLRVAAKAVIINEHGKVLLLREASTYEEGTHLGRYQIPGGRLNPGESYEDGLRREAKEETGLAVEPLYPIFVGEWRPTIKGVPTQIIAIFTVCKARSSDIKLSEEHDAFEWVNPADYTVDVVDPEPEVLKLLAHRQSS